MAILTAERRSHVRIPAAYAAKLFSRKGDLIGCGRVTDTSESGAFILFSQHGKIPPSGQIRVDMLLPAARGNAAAGDVRKVCYLCRIVRTERLGQMVGVGVALMRKLR